MAFGLVLWPYGQMALAKQQSLSGMEYSYLTVSLDLTVIKIVLHVVHAGTCLV